MSSIIPENFPIYSPLEYNKAMTDLEILFPRDLYHSYVVEGNPDHVIALLETFLKKRDSALDIICQTYDSFTIGDTGEIKNWHSMRNVTSGKRICIIGAKFINREAEQSLLKIIEEPKKNTHFFLVVPNASLLLDTIHSRTHLVKIAGIENSSLERYAETFIKASAKARLQMVEEFIKEHKTAETSGRLRFEATELITIIERQMYARFVKDRKDKGIQFILEELDKGRDCLSTPGASVKMILEHIALML
jgi:hypothetical protein